MILDLRLLWRPDIQDQRTRSCSRRSFFGTVIGESRGEGDFYVRTMVLVLVEYYSETEILNLKKEQGDDIYRVRNKYRAKKTPPRAPQMKILKPPPHFDFIFFLL